ncbi:lipopolysaccharide assembly protein LapB, partial [Neisseria sp. P0018.S003]
KLIKRNPDGKADTDMIRSIIGRKLKKRVMYRCRNCNLKPQVFFWHCPACNKWKTFTPNKIEIG